MQAQTDVRKMRTRSDWTRTTKAKQHTVMRRRQRIAKQTQRGRRMP